MNSQPIKILFFAVMITVLSCGFFRVSAEQPRGYLDEALHAETQAVSGPLSKPINTGMLVVRVALSLVFVIGLMLVVAYLVRKVMPDGVVKGRQRLIKVIETGFIAPKLAVYVVDVAGDILVIGSAPGSVVLLDKIEDPDRRKIVLTSRSYQSGAGRPFSDILQAFTRPQAGRHDAPADGEQDQEAALRKSITDIHAQIEKLKGLRHD